MITLSEDYHRFLRDTRWFIHAGEHNAKELSYLTLGLVGETGEFADLLKKLVRVSGFDNREAFRNQLEANAREIHSELGDILWYLTNIAMFFGMTIEDLMVANTEKLYYRLTNPLGGQHPEELENIEWPLKSLSSEDASKLTLLIESQIMDPNALTFTDTDTS